MDINNIWDSGTFINLNRYTDKKSAVVIGSAKLGNNKVVCIIFNKKYKMGTMSIVEGQLVVEAFRYATKRRLPVIAYIESGGVRIDDGPRALWQMARTIAAVKIHNKKRLLFISIFGNPSLGGVSASFASLCDISIALPNTIIGFTGKKIIAETIGKDLPNDFQTASYAYQNGMVDLIIEEENIRSMLIKLLNMHVGGKDFGHLY